MVNEYTIIDKRRVKIPERRKNKNNEDMGLEPSYGYYKELVTPWGLIERCYVVTVPALSGEKRQYASVYKPVTNPGVQWSVFEVFA